MQFRKYPVLLLLLICCRIPSLANFYYSKDFPFSGTQPDLLLLLAPGKSGTPAFWSIPSNKAFFLQLKAKLLKEAHPEADFRFQSDLFFCNYILGDTAAFSALQTLHAAHPEEYNLAANLSLLYEQKGDFMRALELAGRAFSLNPSAHFGSGNISLRIQKFRAGQLRPLSTIVGLNATDTLEAWLNNKKSPLPGNADTLLLQLAWILHLRTALFPAPDSITAQLLTDFADLVARTNARVQARPFYETALLYAPEKKDFFAQRLAVMNASEKEVKSTFRWAALVWAVPIVIILIAFVGNWRNRARRTPPERGNP